MLNSGTKRCLVWCKILLNNHGWCRLLTLTINSSTVACLHFDTAVQLVDRDTVCRVISLLLPQGAGSARNIELLLVKCKDGSDVRWETRASKGPITTILGLLTSLANLRQQTFLISFLLNLILAINRSCATCCSNRANYCLIHHSSTFSDSFEIIHLFFGLFSINEVWILAEVEIVAWSGPGYWLASR